LDCKIETLPEKSKESMSWKNALRMSDQKLEIGQFEDIFSYFFLKCKKSGRIHSTISKVECIKSAKIN